MDTRVTPLGSFSVDEVRVNKGVKRDNKGIIVLLSVTSIYDITYVMFLRTAIETAEERRPHMFLGQTCSSYADKPVVFSALGGAGKFYYYYGRIYSWELSLKFRPSRAPTIRRKSGARAPCRRAGGLVGPRKLAERSAEASAGRNPRPKGVDLISHPAVATGVACESPASAESGAGLGLVISSMANIRETWRNEPIGKQGSGRAPCDKKLFHWNAHYICNLNSTGLQFLKIFVELSNMDSKA